LNFSSTHLQILSVIEGNSIGEVYTNDSISSVIILRVRENSEIYIFGEKPEDLFLSEFMKEVFIQRKLHENSNTFSLTIYYENEEWEQDIAKHFIRFSPILLKRKHLLKTIDSTKTYNDNQNNTIRIINKDFLNEKFKNMEDLCEEMVSERDSIEDFLSKSFGVCICNKDEIISWCLSEYNAENFCEVGIETVDEFRLKGYGATCLNAFVKEAANRGIKKIGWHCWSDNIGSEKTAKKNGFQITNEHNVLHFVFNKFDNCIYKSWKYDSYYNDLDLAISEYEKAYNMIMDDYDFCLKSPHNSYIGVKNLSHYLYNYACLLSRNGDVDRALEILEKAIDDGWKNFKHMRTDSDLVNLRDEGKLNRLISKKTK